MAVTTTNLGVITAYGDAVAAGYTGTKAEWQALMASYATVGQQAVDAKNAAVAAKDTAVAKATEATTAASTATTKANEASASAQSIAQSAAQIQENTDDIDQLKSDFADMQSDGVVPSAEQILTDKGITDSVPYHYRKIGGDGADRLYDQIVGGTVNWNQLVQNGNFADGLTNWGASSNSNPTVSSGVLTFTPIAKYGNVMASVKQFIYEHKYILFCGIKTGNATNNIAIGASDNVYFTYVKPVGTGTAFAPYAYVFNIASSTISNTCRVFVRTEANSDFTPISVKDVMLFDLTAMFGSTIADYIYQLEQTTAGAGVAFFKALFPNDYYEYNSGELVSVSGLSEHKMVGFNQWDEKWEVGGYANATGTPWATDDRTRSKSTDYIKVVPNTTYYCGVSKATNFYFYDADKNYISYAEVSAGATFAPPTNARYMRFTVHPNYGTTYKNDICINISDPAKNGTYEPYKGHSYQLDSTLTLRGLFKLDANNKLYADGDTYDADGTVTRKYGLVDLGTLSWSRKIVSETGFYYFVTHASGIKLNTQLICSKYMQTRHAPNDPNMPDKSIYNRQFFAFADNVIVRDDAYTDGTSFKTAMSGVMLVYELATPTTEEADPYQHLQQCDSSGTEEYVSTCIVPIGHNSFYPENLRAKVEQLPWNFANLIAPTESAFVATRNYTTGALFIVSNVLYKATSNIANGGTITPNTNCTATTLAEIISALA